MGNPLTTEASEKDERAWPAEEQPRLKKEEEEDEEDHGGRDGEEAKPAEHTTINVTNRLEGSHRDDCSDITDHHEAEEQSSRTFPQKVSSVAERS
jgi:hypothetical protein